MAKMRKGNVILHVNETEVQHYLLQGYNLIDANGTVLREGDPQTEGDFRRAYLRNINKINELTAEVNALKSELEELKKPKKAKTSEAK